MRAQRLLKEVYISCKYSERLFLGKVEKSKEELVAELAEAVKQNDIALAAKCIAHRAEVASAIPDDPKHRCLLHGTQ